MDTRVLLTSFSSLIKSFVLSHPRVPVISPDESLPGEVTSVSEKELLGRFLSNRLSLDESFAPIFLTSKIHSSSKTVTSHSQGSGIWATTLYSQVFPRPGKDPDNDYKS